MLDIDKTQSNDRFDRYCLPTQQKHPSLPLTDLLGPFCQISLAPSALPLHGLREPPAYARNESHKNEQLGIGDDCLPAYSALEKRAPLEEKGREQYQDTLHFLDAAHDTIASLALRYGVPQQALRQKNNLFADHLLVARRTILIPGEYYTSGISLSPKPIEDEEEELRKSKIRRWMVATKNPEYAPAHISRVTFPLDNADVHAATTWQYFTYCKLHTI